MEKTTASTGNDLADELIEHFDRLPFDYDRMRFKLWLRKKLAATPSGLRDVALAKSCGGEILCDSHRTAYELAPPKKCVICDLVEGYSELANRPSGGAEKWTEVTVTEIIVDAFNSAGEVRPSQLIAERHNATLK